MTSLKDLWNAAHEYSGRDPATGLYPLTPMTQALYAFESELRAMLAPYDERYNFSPHSKVADVLRKILGEDET